MLGFSRMAAVVRAGLHRNAVALCRLVSKLPPSQNPRNPQAPRGPDLSHPPRLARILELAVRAAAEDSDFQVLFWGALHVAAAVRRATWHAEGSVAATVSDPGTAWGCEGAGWTWLQGRCMQCTPLDGQKPDSHARGSAPQPPRPHYHSPTPGLARPQRHQRPQQPVRTSWPGSLPPP